jgi:hypothetical protein
MNTISMSITLKAIQDLLDELEGSKQSRLRAWSVLKRLRMVLSEVRISLLQGLVAINQNFRNSPTTARKRRKLPAALAGCT